MSDITDLERQNHELKQKLQEARNWMQKEVKESQKEIASQQTHRDAHASIDQLLDENTDDIISRRISEFFSEELMLNIPTSVIENIIFAETSYYHLKNNAHFDGFSILSSYNKAFDSLIEHIVTKGWRKYAKKDTTLRRTKNDLLEKSLENIVGK